METVLKLVMRVCVFIQSMKQCYVYPFVLHNLVVQQKVSDKVYQIEVNTGDRYDWLKILEASTPVWPESIHKKPAREIKRTSSETVQADRQARWQQVVVVVGEGCNTGGVIWGRGA